MPTDPMCLSLLNNKAIDEKDPVIFLPGVKGRYRIESGSLVNGQRILLSGPEDLVLNKDGSIEWTPPLSIAVGAYDVALENRTKEMIDAVNLKMTVLPSRTVEGEFKGNYFKVTDKSSGLNGFLFEFANAPSTDVEFREVSTDCLPEQGYFHKTVSTGFYSLSDVEFDLYVPEYTVLFRLWNPYSVLRTSSHYWSNYSSSTHGYERRSSWSPLYRWSEQIKIDGTKYLKYKNMNANGLMVIGLSVHNHNAL